MTEKLLQYIWRFQYFNLNELGTVAGEPLEVLNAGQLNTNQGPDFLDAKIKVKDTVWAGNIELHLLSSDWTVHKHSADKNYSNIILHVVWKNDKDLQLGFPVLELESKVSYLLLARYHQLMNARTFIACEAMVSLVEPFTWTSWKHRLLVERMQRKIETILGFLSDNNNHWEETFWWMIARNFGIKVNSEAFEKLARSLPLKLLGRHKKNIHQAEAMLFGQAGLLDNEFMEAYPRMLQREYLFYKKKYALQPVRMPLHFLRMRPGNFPSIRLAQLAMLIHNSSHLFSTVKETIQLKDLRSFLDVTANDYWHYHYIFDHPTAFKKKNVGRAMIDSILINTIAPLVFAFGQHYKDEAFKDRALNWLEQIDAENNSITRGFNAISVGCKNAFDSQALIELKNEYCDKTRCLECAVGNKIIRGEISKFRHQ